MTAVDDVDPGDDLKPELRTLKPSAIPRAGKRSRV
jgi:hypothetical protein